MRYRLEHLPSSLADAIAQRLEAAGGQRSADAPDALVVGIGSSLPPARVLDLRLEDWDRAVASARSAFVAVRDTAAELVERDAAGRIVIVIAPPAVRVVEGMAATAVPGAFLTTIARVAAAELGSRGIAVNVLVAGWTEPAPAALAAATPLGRLAAPDEIAAACEFLLSDQASFVTGSVLEADGGWAISKADGGSPFLAGA